MCVCVYKKKMHLVKHNKTMDIVQGHTANE